VRAYPPHGRGREMCGNNRDRGIGRFFGYAIRLATPAGQSAVVAQAALVAPESFARMGRNVLIRGDSG
jgi:hypothetical protein